MSALGKKRHNTPVIAPPTSTTRQQRHGPDEEQTVDEVVLEPMETTTQQSARPAQLGEMKLPPKSRKLLRMLVAARGLEPRTYGL